jgi:hypothetical protein
MPSMITTKNLSNSDMNIEFMSYTKCVIIRQPKGYNKVLIKLVSCRESHIGYIFGTNLNLVIIGAEINLGEHLSSH